MTLQQRRILLRIVVTQFLSSLADSALLVVAIALLTERHASLWMLPALRLFFYGASVLMAPITSIFVDRYPKEQILVVTSMAKFVGCALLVLQVHPLVAYALVGTSAAAYVPAKYGMLPELLPADALVCGNAWLEVSTVLSVLLGIGIGSYLLSNDLLAGLLPKESVMLHAAVVILAIYALTVATSSTIPATGCARHTAAVDTHRYVLRFYLDQQRLWRDPEGCVAITVTCLFWAAAATLQFIVLRWGQEVAHLSLSQASLLQLPVALGLVTGALAAGRWITLPSVVKLLPIGLAVGGTLIGLSTAHDLFIVAGLLTAVGVLSGLLLIPMNALLQHRGALLMPAGQSISVQSFSENLVSTVFLSAYGALSTFGTPVTGVIAGLGVLVIVTILMMLM